ncbi:MAG: hypothetical protein IPG05_13235 [Gemmatimonadetes bacterium]|nr:hypothetical protein [Gemmatimonadota bacterium]
MTWAQQTATHPDVAPCRLRGRADDAAGGLATGNTAPLAPAVRDSAGVAIFEHAADAFERAPRFVMSEKPVTTVKGTRVRG